MFDQCPKNEIPSPPSKKQPEKSSNVVWQDTQITKQCRNKLNNHKSAILWFTGLSGSGKSTVASALEDFLHNQGIRTYILDGDNVRHGLNADLGFCDKDRTENIRRIGEVSKLFVDAGVMVLTSFISPFISDRELVRNLMPDGEFIEIYIKCPLNVCEDRDIKGLYKRARQGEIKHFTGIDSPYEAPSSPEITIDTSKLSIEEAMVVITDYLIRHQHIEPSKRSRLEKHLLDPLKQGFKLK